MKRESLAINRESEKKSAAREGRRIFLPAGFSFLFRRFEGMIDSGK